ncbi:MAG: DNA-directed RNA polymerase subunit L [Candidatus Hadarchaeota archaeon]
MEIELLEEDKNKLKIKILDEGHTLANALRKELHDQDHVVTASYNIDHPLIGEPVMHITTSGDVSPREALVKAANKLGEDYSKVKSEFDKTLEEL